MADGCQFGKEIAIGQTPNHATFCGDPKEVSEISAIENLCSRKSGPKFTNILKTCYLLKPPNHAKFYQDR